MCHQVPKPIKLLEGIGNGGNSALIQQYCEQMIIIFNLRSIAVYRKPWHRFTAQC